MNILRVALTDNMHDDNNFSYYCTDDVFCIDAQEGMTMWLMVLCPSAWTKKKNEQKLELVKHQTDLMRCSPLVSCLSSIYNLFFDLMLSAFILNILLLWRIYVDSILWCLHFYRQNFYFEWKF